MVKSDFKQSQLKSNHTEFKRAKLHSILFEIKLQGTSGTTTKY